jgi:hypothetical protein
MAKQPTFVAHSMNPMTDRPNPASPTSPTGLPQARLQTVCEPIHQADQAKSTDGVSR